GVASAFDYPALDLIGNVRDDLHGAAEIVTSALLAQHGFIDASGGERVATAQSAAEKALVMAEIEIGLGAILGNEHFAVLEWTHRAGIDVDVGVQLQHGHLQPACLKNGTERSRGDSLAQRGNN